MQQLIEEIRTHMSVLFKISESIAMLDMVSYLLRAYFHGGMPLTRLDRFLRSGGDEPGLWYLHTIIVHTGTTDWIQCDLS